MTNPNTLRASILANSQLSAEEQRSLVAVLDQAVLRYGQNPGFKVIVSYMHYSELLQALPFRVADETLSGKDLGKAIAFTLKSQDQLFVITDVFLRSVAKDEGPDSLAGQILAQMNSDTESGATFRKPVQYIAVTDGGLVVSIAIDDRFWTSEW